MKKTAKSSSNICRSILFISFFVSISSAYAIKDPSSLEDKIGVDQKISENIRLNLPFTTHWGKDVKIGDFFNGKTPVLLVPVYYRCPGLCSITLNELIGSINKSDLKLGQDYRIITYTINPAEGYELGAKKRRSYIDKLENQNISDEDWVYLAGSEDSITSLSSDIGFKYLKEDKEFAHTSTLILLTPTGKISGYLSGVDTDPQEYRLGLVSASDGNIGSFADQIFLFCFQYDSIKGKYTLSVLKLSQLIGGVTVVLLLGLIIGMKLKEKRSVQ